MPLNGDDGLDSLEGVAESGRAQIWCQVTLLTTIFD